MVILPVVTASNSRLRLSRVAKSSRRWQSICKNFQCVVTISLTKKPQKHPQPKHWKHTLGQVWLSSHWGVLTWMLADFKAPLPPQLDHGRSHGVRRSCTMSALLWWMVPVSPSCTTRAGDTTASHCHTWPTGPGWPRQPLCLVALTLYNPSQSAVGSYLSRFRPLSVRTCSVP